MLKLNEFILLKATFNQELHQAVMSKDEAKIVSILAYHYTYEILAKGFIQYPHENLDVELLFCNHLKQLDEDLSWAL